jgi:hypothetical protein
VPRRRHRSLVRHLPRPGLLRRVPRECTEVPVIQALGPDPRSLVRRPELRRRRATTTRVHREARRAGPQARSELRHLPYSGELPHLPRGDARRRAGDSGGRARSGTRRRAGAPTAGQPRSGFLGEPRPGREQPAAVLHYLPRTRRVLQLPSTEPGRCGPGVPRGGLPEPAPAAAYARETDCASCHNTRQFCTNCCQCRLVRGRHAPARLSRRQAQLPPGARPAARQELESCVSCHTESQCMRCHAASVVGGRNFNPHGRASTPTNCGGRTADLHGMPWGGIPESGE